MDKGGKKTKLDNSSRDNIQITGVLEIKTEKNQRKKTSKQKTKQNYQKLSTTKICEFRC